MSRHLIGLYKDTRYEDRLRYDRSWISRGWVTKNVRYAVGRKFYLEIRGRGQRAEDWR